MHNTLLALLTRLKTNHSFDWGIVPFLFFVHMHTIPFHRKDARLPVQLQRAMAAEAEAAREARAKVR